MNIRILLADDHQIVREGLRALLETEPDFVIVAEAENGMDAIAMTHRLAPDVVIMDIAMPDISGIEATRGIKRDLPEVKVIALSMHDEKRFVREMLKAGASGYLLKDAAFQELTQAIKLVMDGKTYLSPEISGVLVEDYVDSVDNGVKGADILGPRERQVLTLLAEGKATREIAEHLAIGVKTVETYRHRIMHKLGLRTVAELTKFAIREGLTTLDR
ncbi:MAG: response regulator transcription factor [Candidatus Lernaella stagnicola]|nr:response regulator transcription factor [Candidatus Lernaella stagnicola]